MLLSFRMNLSDVECVSEIFNDTMHRAVSLRQLSFLLSSAIESKRDENLLLCLFIPTETVKNSLYTAKTVLWREGRKQDRELHKNYF